MVNQKTKDLIAEGLEAITQRAIRTGTSTGSDVTVESCIESAEIGLAKGKKWKNEAEMQEWITEEIRLCNE